MDDYQPASSLPVQHPTQDPVEITEPLWDAESADVEQVAVDVLLPGDSPRLSGEDQEHIRRLAAGDAQLPPIIVHRTTMRIIDGMHRLQAAVARGNATIDVRFFDGSDVDCFVLAVKSNVAHGLPLSRTDRTAAAKRIIKEHPTWSDRRIASVSGLSAGTVRMLRRESSSAEVVTTRIGRDGRQRPLDAASGRLAASRILSDRPDATLREVASEAGISLATARDVRQRVQHGENPIPAQHRSGSQTSEAHRSADGRTRQAQSDRVPMSGAEKADISTVLVNLTQDPSLRFTESGRRLLRWLSTVSAPLGSWYDLAPTVPSHCTYVVARLARQCADEWRIFADELATRTDAAG
jgi:ParB-like chromosome segregation protein Spo0J